RPYTGAIVAEARRYPDMIHDVSRKPPRDAATAGVAVESRVWSTAAMNIGRNTAANRLRNCSRVTGPPGVPGEGASTACGRSDFTGREGNRLATGARSPTARSMT